MINSDIYSIQSIGDNTFNSVNISFLNESQTLHIDLTVITKSKSAFEQYINGAFSWNLKQTLNSKTNIIMVQMINVNIHLETQNALNTDIIIGCTSAGICFLCLLCFCVNKNRSKQMKIRKIKMEFDKLPIEYIYNNGNIAFGSNLTNPFENGMYFGYCTETGKNKEYKMMSNIHLQFNNDGQTVAGNGKDDNGEYKITGTYSNDSQRLEFQKKYVSSESVVSVRLEYNLSQSQFKGIWLDKDNQTGTWVIRKCGGSKTDEVAFGDNVQTNKIVYDENGQATVVQANDQCVDTPTRMNRINTLSTTEATTIGSTNRDTSSMSIELPVVFHHKVDASTEL